MERTVSPNARAASGSKDVDRRAEGFVGAKGGDVGITVAGCQCAIFLATAYMPFRFLQAHSGSA